MPKLPSLDQVIIGFDSMLRTLAAKPASLRPHPDARIEETELSDEEKNHAAGLMRVNHCGEICAQALYQGQALTAQNPVIRDALQQAAREEIEHLAWTEHRLHELGGRTSVLNPVWYAGSLAMGVAAGLAGDKWNLGFLAETEKQVGAHLQSHLQSLPAQDAKSRAIVEQMFTDEMLHAELAQNLGGEELSFPVRVLMKRLSKIMTLSSYRV